MGSLLREIPYLDSKKRITAFIYNDFTVILH